jgi:hypothetical protein
MNATVQPHRRCAIGQVLRNHHSDPGHTAEIVELVSESLEVVQRRVISALQQQEGIASAKFCPCGVHRMQVRYNRDRYFSQNVRCNIRSQKLHTRLIGPV